MRVLVCVKQVPNTDEMHFDQQKKTLMRDGIQNILNPYDEYALEMACELKNSINDVNITVLSMGPMQTEKSLRHCLAIGADEAVLVSDNDFAASDTLATSYILSRAVNYLAKKENDFDLILCGKNAIDGDTAQVGPELAEWLSIVSITDVIDWSISESQVLATHMTGDGYEEISCQLPCLLTIGKQVVVRKPTLKAFLRAKKADIQILSGSDLSIDSTKVGILGSPTQLLYCYTVMRDRRRKEVVDYESEEKMIVISKIVGKLQKIIRKN